MAAAVVAIWFGSTGIAVARGEARVMRTLVIRATWSNQALPDAATVLAEGAQADAYLRRVSFGHLGMTFDVTPVIQDFVVPPGCFSAVAGTTGLGPGAAAAKDAAARLGYDISTYERFVYLLPAEVCGHGGLGYGPDVLAAGHGFEWLGFIHEFGHTLGFPHAGSAPCITCQISEYGDSFSPMGRGAGDFSAWEKAQQGWLSKVTNAIAPGRYEVAVSDAPSELPQALVVPTGNGEVWIEHLSSGEVIIRAVLQDDSGLSRTVLLGAGVGTADAPDLVHATRTGANELTFSWTDRQPPSRPKLLADSVHSGSLLLTWLPSEDSASGVAYYRVKLDGHTRAVTEQAFTILQIPRGRRHVVTLTAVDRAGNASAPAVVRLRKR